MNGLKVILVTAGLAAPLLESIGFDEIKDRLEEACVIELLGGVIDLV